LRVALVHSFYSSNAPSGENEVVELQRNALMKLGFQVQLFGRYSDEISGKATELVAAGVKVATGWGGGFEAEIRAYNPDVIHVHNLFPNFGTSWLRHTRVPVVATLHNFRLLCAKATLYRAGSVCTLCPDEGSFNAVRNSCYRDSAIATIPLALANRKSLPSQPLVKETSHLIAPSSRLANVYTRYGVPKEKISVIPNFRLHAPGNHSARGSRFCFIGRLSEEKGLIPLLKAWPEEFFLDIYGDGPLRDEVEGLQSRNIVYHGPLDPSEVARTVAKSAGLLFPSVCFEAAPAMAYVLALSLGLPTIALEGNSVADDIRTARTGVVLKSWEGLPGALRLVLGDSPYRINSLKRYESEYTESVWQERISRLYADLVSRPI